jgi:hypothetical protein
VPRLLSSFFVGAEVEYQIRMSHGLYLAACGRVCQVGESPVSDMRTA